MIPSSARAQPRPAGGSPGADRVSNYPHILGGEGVAGILARLVAAQLVGETPLPANP
jgi:hypothetical protein